MSRSDRTFARWTAHEDTTWAYGVFLKHDSELHSLLCAYAGGMAFAYKSLGNSGASWTDPANIALQSTDKYLKQFHSLRKWSDAEHNLVNWIRLNAALTMASNLETYIASIVRLAIRSDPGTLLGVPGSLDGAALLKNGSFPGETAESQVTLCTKGDWGGRIAAVERLFPGLPASVPSAIGDLEKLRGIRNRIGHAFGRDIAQARRHGTKAILPMEGLSEARMYRFKRTAVETARAIDAHLLARHIGDFEVLLVYERERVNLNLTRPIGQQAVDLKKVIGAMGANSRGKDYCRSLIEFWNGL